MERDAEEPEDHDTSVPWSGSDASQDRSASESLADSFSEDEASDAEFRPEPRPAGVEAEEKAPELYRREEWEPAGDQQQLPGLNGSDAEASYRGEDEEDDLCPQRPGSEHEAGEIAETRSSSLSLGCVDDVTLALPSGGGQGQEASSRRCPGTLNAGVDSSEEGGSREAPPASVFFGMSDEGAEQAEAWNSGCDTDLRRAERQRLRNTHITHSESQSERRAKENKSKCKKIARLLTDAPNPRNKGALLFNKRRQRVEKYTLVSYGTGADWHGSRGQVEEEAEEVRAAGFRFVESTDSESEEEFCLDHQLQNSGPGWGSLRDMEAPAGAEGKGLLMFAKCRKRADEAASAQEQLRSKGTGEGGFIAQNAYEAQRSYCPAQSEDGGIGQPAEYREHLQQVNRLPSTTSRALVSNRTAKPFPGFPDGGAAAAASGVGAPPTKRQELKFKVPVLTNTNPQVWSPTGDVIASRDERISVPAIRTGILPESKRRAGAKPSSTAGQGGQHPGGRRAPADAEEDCFSLGAEACNFMQPRRVKLKNPPPVAPKPAVSPARAPARRSPLSEPYVPDGGPAARPCSTSVRSHSQERLHQSDREPAQPRGGGPGGARRGRQPPQPAVSMPVCSPASSPPAPPPSAKSPPGRAPPAPAEMSSHPKASRSPRPVPRGGSSDGGFRQTGGAFANQPSCSEKFLFRAERVGENQPRSPSPTSSLPKGWRYSSSVRAPPPVAYNPVLAPFYPPPAARQPPSSSPQIRPKSTEKTPKQPNALDVAKHRPYQLSRSLFGNEAAPEARAVKPGPVSKFETTKRSRMRFGSSQKELDGPATPAAAPSGPQNHPAHQSARPEQPPADAEAAASAGPVGTRPGQSLQPASRAWQPSSAGRSLASAFSPASLIARGARQMAPRPKFCATKPAGLTRSQSLSLPKQHHVMPSGTPKSRPGIYSSQFSRQKSLQEKVYKPLTPWEAASRSPLGSVEEAFVLQDQPSSLASGLVLAGQPRPLPEPPEEWKRRVSLEPAAAVGVARYPAAPAFQAPPLSQTFSPEKRSFYGPPFRPAQPLTLAGRPSAAHAGQPSNAGKYSPLRGGIHQS